MKYSTQELRDLLNFPEFPRSAAYAPHWVLENQMGPHALWLTEWLCEKMKFAPGMRILDYFRKRQRSGGVFWDPAECCCFHTREWWQAHWEKSELVDIQVADVMPDGWQKWLRFEHVLEATGMSRFPSDEEVLEIDKGRYLGFIRVIAQRRETGLDG